MFTCVYSHHSGIWHSWQLQMRKMGGGYKGNDLTAAHGHLSSSMKHASLTTHIPRLQEIGHFTNKQHPYLLCSSLYMNHIDKLMISGQKECCDVIKSMLLTIFQLQFFWQEQCTSDCANTHQAWNIHSVQMDLSKYTRLSTVWTLSEGKFVYHKNQKLSIHMNHHFIFKISNKYMKHTHPIHCCLSSVLHVEPETMKLKHCKYCHSNKLLHSNVREHHNYETDPQYTLQQHISHVSQLGI